MKQTKIDWCDCTLNPVKGCSNGCEYCYARKLNERFHFVKDWNKPEFFPEVLEQLKSKKPRSIFMDSMSDCGCWTVSQIRRVARAMKDNSQHNYIFLTKTPKLFVEKCKTIVEDANNGNVFVGVSVTRKSEISRLNYLPLYANKFVSIEPMLEDFGDIYNTDLCNPCFYANTIIIGAETGNRKDKVIPKKEWIMNIVNAVDKKNKENENFINYHKNGHLLKIRIFMKESLREIMGKDFRQDKLLWDTNKEGNNEITK